MLKKESLVKGLVLVLILTLAMVPLLSFAGENGSADQIGSYVDVYGPIGNNNGIEGEKTGKTFTKGEAKIRIDGKGEHEELYVDYSKLIAPTSTENAFDITLRVETNDTRKYITEKTDVILVFDVSGSMDYDMNGRSSSNNNFSGPTRWETYKPAMEAFITDFLGSVDGNRLQIVAFGGVSGETSAAVSKNITGGWKTDAEEVIELFEDNDTASSFRDTHFGTKGYNFTNLEAGFNEALKVLNGVESTDSTYGSVIFMSDGAANSWTTSSYSSGDDSNETKAQKAAVAKQKEVKNKLKAIYEDSSTTATEATMYGFAIGNGVKSQNVFTGSSDQCTRVFEATTSDQIKSQFKNITTEITQAVSVWTVNDPMSNYVSYDVNASDSGKGISFDESTKTLSWDLTEANVNAVTEDEGLTYTYYYEMTYRVVLDTTFDGYKAGEYYPTNKETSLEYAFTTYVEDSEGRVIANPNPEKTTTLFKIPTVKGPGVVAGEEEIIVPVQQEVLPDYEEPVDDGNVLGEEAKTMDTMDWALIAGIALLMTIGLTVLYRKSTEE